MIIIHDNFLTEAECRQWIEQSPIYNKPNPKGNEDWLARNKNITHLPIVERVRQFHKEKDNLDLMIQEASLQVWASGTEAIPHVHNEQGGRQGTGYNSIIYLNDDFEGGEFITPQLKSSISPIPGRLIIFDGSTVEHGIAPIKGNTRYTIIFWWKK
jgi:hypothetical protein